MSDGGTGGRNAQAFGEGVLGRATAFVYWHLIVGALMCLTSLPVVAAFLVTSRTSAILAVAPLLLIAYAPVLSAALYALRDRVRSEGLTPARSFLRGLRLGWADALRAWALPMAVLALIVLGSFARGVDAVAGYTGAMVTVGVILVLWAMNTLVIVTFFSFRWRDAARLAVFYLGRRWIVTLGELSLLVVATALVWGTTEGVLWLFAVVFAAFLLVIARPLVSDVEARFTRSD